MSLIKAEIKIPLEEWSFDRDFNPIKAFRIYSTLRFKNHLKEATNTNPFVSYITEAFARRPQLQLHVVDG